MAEVQQPKLVHKQFNSPIGLYSEQNIKDTINRDLKAIGVNGIELHDQIPKVSSSHLANSYVLKMLQEEESERYLVRNIKQHYNHPRYQKSNDYKTNNTVMKQLNNERNKQQSNTNGNFKTGGGKRPKFENFSKFDSNTALERQSRPRHRFNQEHEPGPPPAPASTSKQIKIDRETVLKINRRHPNFYRDLSWPPPQNYREPRSHSEDNCYYFDESTRKQHSIDQIRNLFEFGTIYESHKLTSKSNCTNNHYKNNNWKSSCNNNSNNNNNNTSWESSPSLLETIAMNNNNNSEMNNLNSEIINKKFYTTRISTKNSNNLNEYNSRSRSLSGNFRLNNTNKQNANKKNFEFKESLGHQQSSEYFNDPSILTYSGLKTADDIASLSTTSQSNESLSLVNQNNQQPLDISATLMTNKTFNDRIQMDNKYATKQLTETVNSETNQDNKMNLKLQEKVTLQQNLQHSSFINEENLKSKIYPHNYLSSLTNHIQKLEGMNQSNFESNEYDAKTNIKADKLDESVFTTFNQNSYCNESLLKHHENEIKYNFNNKFNEYYPKEGTSTTSPLLYKKQKSNSCNELPPLKPRRDIITIATTPVSYKENTNFSYNAMLHSNKIKLNLNSKIKQNQTTKTATNTKLSEENSEILYSKDDWLEKRAAKAKLLNANKNLHETTITDSIGDLEVPLIPKNPLSSSSSIVSDYFDESILPRPPLEFLDNFPDNCVAMKVEKPTKEMNTAVNRISSGDIDINYENKKPLHSFKLPSDFLPKYLRESSDLMATIRAGRASSYPKDIKNVLSINLQERFLLCDDHQYNKIKLPTTVATSNHNEHEKEKFQSNSHENFNTFPKKISTSSDENSQSFEHENNSIKDNVTANENISSSTSSTVNRASSMNKSLPIRKINEVYVDDNNKIYKIIPTISDNISEKPPQSNEASVAQYFDTNTKIAYPYSKEKNENVQHHVKNSYNIINKNCKIHSINDKISLYLTETGRDFSRCPIIVTNRTNINESNDNSNDSDIRAITSSMEKSTTTNRVVFSNSSNNSTKTYNNQNEDRFSQMKNSSNEIYQNLKSPLSAMSSLFLRQQLNQSSSSSSPPITNELSNCSHEESTTKVNENSNEFIMQKMQNRQNINNQSISMDSHSTRPQTNLLTMSSSKMTSPPQIIDVNEAAMEMIKNSMSSSSFKSTVKPKAIISDNYYGDDNINSEESSSLHTLIAKPMNNDTLISHECIQLLPKIQQIEQQNKDDSSETTSKSGKQQFYENIKFFEEAQRIRDDNILSESLRKRTPSPKQKPEEINDTKKSLLEEIRSKRKKSDDSGDFQQPSKTISETDNRRELGQETNKNKTTNETKTRKNNQNKFSLNLNKTTDTFETITNITYPDGEYIYFANSTPTYQNSNIDEQILEIVASQNELQTNDKFYPQDENVFKKGSSSKNIPFDRSLSNPEDSFLHTENMINKSKMSHLSYPNYTTKDKDNNYALIERSIAEDLRRIDEFIETTLTLSPLEYNKLIKNSSTTPPIPPPRNHHKIYKNPIAIQNANKILVLETPLSIIKQMFLTTNSAIRSRSISATSTTKSTTSFYTEDYQKNNSNITANQNRCNNFLQNLSKIYELKTTKDDIINSQDKATSATTTASTTKDIKYNNDSKNITNSLQINNGFNTFNPVTIDTLNLNICNDEENNDNNNIIIEKENDSKQEKLNIDPKSINEIKSSTNNSLLSYNKTEYKSYLTPKTSTNFNYNIRDTHDTINSIHSITNQLENMPVVESVLSDLYNVSKELESNNLNNNKDNKINTLTNNILINPNTNNKNKTIQFDNETIRKDEMKQMSKTNEDKQSNCPTSNSSLYTSLILSKDVNLPPQMKSKENSMIKQSQWNNPISKSSSLTSIQTIIDFPVAFMDSNNSNLDTNEKIISVNEVENHDSNNITNNNQINFDNTNKNNEFNKENNYDNKNIKSISTINRLVQIYSKSNNPDIFDDYNLYKIVLSKNILNDYLITKQSQENLLNRAQGTIETNSTNLSTENVNSLNENENSANENPENKISNVTSDIENDNLTANNNIINPNNLQEQQQQQNNSQNVINTSVINSTDSNENKNNSKTNSDPQQYQQNSQQIANKTKSFHRDNDKIGKNNNDYNEIKTINTNINYNQLNATELYQTTIDDVVAFNNDNTKVITINQNLSSNQNLPANDNNCEVISERQLIKPQPEFYNYNKLENLNQHQQHTSSLESNVNSIPIKPYSNETKINSYNEKQYETSSIDQTVCINQPSKSSGQHENEINQNKLIFNVMETTATPTLTSISENLNSNLTVQPLTLIEEDFRIEQLNRPQSTVNDENHIENTNIDSVNHQNKSSIQCFPSTNKSGNKNRFISKKFFKIRSISQPPPLQYFRIHDDDADDDDKFAIFKNFIKSIDNTKAQCQCSALEKLKLLKNSSSSTNINATTSSQDNNIQSYQFKVPSSLSDYFYKKSIQIYDDKIVDSNDDCSLQHSSNENANNIIKRKVEYENSNKNIIKKENSENRHHYYDYYSSDPNIFYKNESQQQEQQQHKQQDLSSMDEYYQRWIDDEGYKRVAWPPTPDRKIVREFTPQPQVQGDTNQGPYYNNTPETNYSQQQQQNRFLSPQPQSQPQSKPESQPQAISYNQYPGKSGIDHPGQHQQSQSYPGYQYFPKQQSQPFQNLQQPQAHYQPTQETDLINPNLQSHLPNREPSLPKMNYSAPTVAFAGGIPVKSIPGLSPSEPQSQISQEPQPIYQSQHQPRFQPQAEEHSAGPYYQQPRVYSPQPQPQSQFQASKYGAWSHVPAPKYQPQQFQQQQQQKHQQQQNPIYASSHQQQNQYQQPSSYPSVPVSHFGQNQTYQPMPNAHESSVMPGYGHDQQQPNYHQNQPLAQNHHQNQDNYPNQLQGQQQYHNQPSHYQNQYPLPQHGGETNAHPNYNVQQLEQNHQPEYNTQSFKPQQQYNPQDGHQDGPNYQQQPEQQQHQQPNVEQQYQQQPPHSGVITLRKDPPYTQKPAPTVVSQPAARSMRGGSAMRGDLKWPPQDCRERMAAEEELRKQLSMGPANRPVRLPKDYSGFFAKHALSHYYPGYKIPPGTQHMFEDY